MGFGLGFSQRCWGGVARTLLQAHGLGEWQRGKVRARTVWSLYCERPHGRRWSGVEGTRLGCVVRCVWFRVLPNKAYALALGGAYMHRVLPNQASTSWSSSLVTRTWPRRPIHLPQGQLMWCHPGHPMTSICIVCVLFHRYICEIIIS